MSMLQVGKRLLMINIDMNIDMVSMLHHLNIKLEMLPK